MATIPPGGIVTVPDPTTGGAGAPVTTTQVINAMWQNAQSKSEAGDARVGQAIALADPAPQMSPVTLDTSYLPPTPPDLPNDDPNNGEAIFSAWYAQMLAMITTNFRSFIDEFFPDESFFEDAYDWCTRAIVDGGTGINADVEQALWQRGRARILADSQRAEMEAEQLWANRRFPMPPGALTNQLNEIRLDSGRKLAEASRDISIKSFDTEIENVRFAVKEVLDLRKKALDAAGDYIKTLMQAPDTAMKLATGLTQIRSELARNLVQLYSAQVTALQPRVQLAIADADIQMRGKEANLRAQEQTIDAKVRAALAGAQMVASMASAGINAINAQASISGQDVSQI